MTCSEWSMGWIHFPVNKVIIREAALRPLHPHSPRQPHFLSVTCDDASHHTVPGVTRSPVLITPAPRWLIVISLTPPRHRSEPASDWLLSVSTGLSLVTHAPTKGDHQTVSSIINNIQHTLSTFHYPPVSPPTILPGCKSDKIASIILMYKFDCWLVWIWST